TIDVTVTYTLTNDNEFSINYEAVSDMDTILTLTNHTYFNLNGRLKENVGNHTVKMNSDQILELDNELIPTGKQLDVSGTLLTFNSNEATKYNSSRAYEWQNDGNKYRATLCRYVYW